MKRIKKLGCVVMAVFLCLCFSVTAFAQVLPDESRRNTCSIRLYKYQVEDLNAWTQAATGLELTAEQKQALGLDKLPSLEGISFLIERVVPNTPADEGSDQASAYKPATDPAYSTTKTTLAGGYIEFSGLSFGTYRITEQASPKIQEKAQPFLVHLPMTHPTTAGEWVYDVYVYPKNVSAAPDIGKEVGGETSTGTALPSPIGNIVPWRIHVAIPDDIATGQLFKVTDTLDARLSYVADSVEVYYKNKDGTRTNLAATDYAFGVSGQTLSVSFTTSAQMAELAKALTGAGSGTPTLYVQFKTLVTALGEGDLGKIKNGGTIEYTDQNGTEFKKDVPDPPDVDVGGLTVKKVNARDTTKTLAGAKFALYPTLADAKAQTNAVKHPVSGDDWTITTLDDGLAKFWGLLYGTYWLVELEGPSGFNMLEEPREVTIGLGTHATELEVKNSPRFVLPATGGRGTMMFTLLGLLLIGGGTIALAVSQKRRARRPGNPKP